MGTKTILVEGKPIQVPDDATDDEIATIIGAPASKRDYALSEVPGAALANAGRDAKDIAKGAIHTATHPTDTILSLLKMAALPVSVPYYGLLKGAESLGYPQGSAEGFKSWALNEPLEFGKQLGDTYGGWLGGPEGWGFTPEIGFGNAKRALAERPLSTAMDALGLTPAGNMLGKTRPVQATKAAIGSAAAKVAEKTGEALSTLPDIFVQSHEGIGPGALKEVVKAGREGNTDVLTAMRNGVNYNDILTRAHDAVDTLVKKRKQHYDTNMAVLEGADVPVDFSKVDRALGMADDIGVYRGKSGTATPIELRSPNEASARKAITDAIEDWKLADPREFHTAYGFDKLKQKISNIVEGVSPTDGMFKPIHAYGGKVLSAIRDTIKEVAPPEYTKAMLKYEEDTNRLKNVRKEFSLGPKATDIQAVKKLQKIYRRTADVAHGEKENLLREALKEAGDESLMSTLAGGQFSSWTPQGIRGTMVPAITAGIAGGALSPWALPMVIAESPRITGETAFAYGKGRRAAERFGQTHLPGAGDYSSQFMREYLQSAMNPTTLAVTRDREEQPRKRGGHLSSLRRR